MAFLHKTWNCEKFVLCTSDYALLEKIQGALKFISSVAKKTQESIETVL